MRTLLAPILAVLVAIAAAACTTLTEGTSQTNAAGETWLRAGQPAIRQDIVAEAPSRRRFDVAEPAAAVRGEVNRKVVGRVTAINRKESQITASMPEGGSFSLTLPAAAVATIREGDDVAVVLDDPPPR
jgi:hypothetical protein